MADVADKESCHIVECAQGHIALDQAVFPSGTPGLALDTLARAPLWSMGLNYRHGTGHGVGAALNVHEGPQSISHRQVRARTQLPSEMPFSMLGDSHLILLTLNGLAYQTRFNACSGATLT